MLNGLNNNLYSQSYKASINSKQIVSVNTTTNQTSSEILGYKIDKDGYFTDEFNKQAGIPSEYKIHSSTLESLVNVAEGTSFFSRTFKSIDIAKTAGNAYKILSQVVGEDTLNSKDSFSLDEIRNFPQGFSYNRQSMQVTTKSITPFMNLARLRLILTAKSQISR